MGKSNGLEGRSEAWQTWAVSRSVEKKKVGGGRRRPPWQKVEVEVSPEEE